MRVVPSRRGLAATFAVFAALGWGTGVVAFLLYDAIKAHAAQPAPVLELVR